MTFKEKLFFIFKITLELRFEKAAMYIDKSNKNKGINYKSGCSIKVECTKVCRVLH